MPKNEDETVAPALLSNEKVASLKEMTGGTPDRVAGVSVAAEDPCALAL
jgi:hypothetical protein